MTNVIKVNFKDDLTLTVKKGTKAKDVIKRLSGEYVNIMGIRVDNKVHMLNYSFSRDCNCEIVDYYSAQGHNIYARSVKLLFIAAIREVFPDLKYVIENKIGEHYYISTEKKLTSSQIAKIEEKMKEFVDAKYSITKERVTFTELKEIYTKIGNEEALENLRSSLEVLFSVYNINDKYYPWLYGRVVHSTEVITSFALESYNEGILLKLPYRDDINCIEKEVHANAVHHTFKREMRLPETLGVKSIHDLNKKAYDEKELERIILMAEERQNKQIYKITDNILSRGNIRVIFISGPSSSGKTTFAQRLQISLECEGISTVLLNMDDYFKNASISKDYESFNHLDYEFFKTQVNELFLGKTINLPLYNFKNNGGTREDSGKKASLPSNGILLVEGIHGLNPKISDFIPKENVFKVYIAPLVTLSFDSYTKISSNNVRLLRRIVRDYQDRKVKLLDTLTRWNSVIHAEKENIFKYVDEADVIFNSMLIYEIGVLKVFAEPIFRDSIDAANPNEHFYTIREMCSMLSSFEPIHTDKIPNNSILKEFVGSGCFKR